ncbi:sigma-70 family RNA polymerase sigma factor [Candidatus Poribacteria bacterium]|nr:sigma-70 family RNA polymerase sigma factor [Candidatus Poribacteria bacterium]
MIEMMDDQLISRLEAEETDALEELIRRYSQTVWRIAISITQNYHDAQDVMQETFMKVIKERGNIKWEKFEGWLKKVTINTAKDRIRRKNRERRRFIPLDQVDEGRLPIWLGEDDEKERVLRCLMEVIRELPEEDRKLLEERYVGGIGYEQMMREREMSFHQLKNKLYRLKVQIREEVRRRLRGIYSLIGLKGLEVMVMEGWKKVMISLVIVLIVAGGGGIVIWRHMGGEKIEGVGAGAKAKGGLVGENASTGSVQPRREDKGDELTFDEFNRLLDELFSIEDDEGTETTEVTFLLTPNSPKVRARPQEEKIAIGQRDETVSLSEEVKKQIADIILTLSDHKQRLESLLDQCDQLIEDVESGRISDPEFSREFEDRMNKRIEVSRKIASYAIELKKLISDGVKIIKYRSFDELYGLYMVGYTITIDSKVGEIIPEIKEYLPLQLATGSIPEDENLTFSDAYRISLQRLKEGKVNKEMLNEYPHVEFTEIK